MELPVGVQLYQAAAFLALGAALGIWYDFLAALRISSAMPTWLTDSVFILGAAFALFTAGVATLEGRARLYMLAFAALGGALWGFGPSGAVRKIFAAWWKNVAKGTKACAKPFATAGKSAYEGGKKIFSNLEKRIKIITDQRKRMHRHPTERKETADEVPKSGIFYDARYIGPDRLRVHDPGGHAAEDRGSRRNGGGASRKSRADAGR
jgi:hypothetical protein